MELTAEGIRKDFIRKTKDANVFTAVYPMDFTLPAGKLTMLTGRSGSGKSTLVNMLSGLLEPTTGRVLFGEQDLYRMEDEALSKLRNAHFGFVPQGQSALMSLTVLENILLPYSLYGNAQDGLAYAQELMEQMHIAHLANAMPAELSGGEMRRMSIARALVKQPEVIFADEPTGDLDDENTETVLSILKNIAGAGTAVLLVTHENMARDYADTIIEMSAGRVK